MSQTAAEAFIDQVASDPDLLMRLETARHSSVEVAGVISDAGYDATPIEVVDAFLERFGRFLNDDVLAQYAGGLSVADIESAYAIVIELFSNPGVIGL
jgi:predicted ribosomally synthesized peptide with nif11-like leader